MSSGHKRNDDASKRRTTLVSQNSTAGVSYIAGRKEPSRKRQYDDEEDTSTLSSSRVELLEEEIERITMANTQLAEENEKLRTLWEKERKEREQFHKKIMQKALQTVTMEKETYAKVKKYAQEKLFRAVKFITSENELKDLENPHSIASHTMDELKIKEEDRIAWWSVYKVAITDGIADRQNQINTNMKNWVLRKSIAEWLMKIIIYTNNNHCHDLTGRNAINTELHRQNQEVPLHLELPKLSEILKMRQKPGVLDNDRDDDQEYNLQEQAFTFLVEHLLGHVIGKREWDMKKCFHMVSDHVSISDEAYTLLLLENVYEKWLKIKQHQQPGEKRTIVKGKYTDPEKGASNEKYKGWTVDGIQRYNQLYQKVQHNRNQKWAKTVEMKAKEEFQGRYKGKLVGTQIRRKKRRKKGWELDKDDDGDTNNEYPVAMNELGNVMCEDDNSSVSSESSIE